MSDDFADRKSEISYDKKQLRRSPFLSSFFYAIYGKFSKKPENTWHRQEFSRDPIKGENAIVSGSHKKRVPNSLSGRHNIFARLCWRICDYIEIHWVGFYHYGYEWLTDMGVIGKTWWLMWSLILFFIIVKKELKKLKKAKFTQFLKFHSHIPDKMWITCEGIYIKRKIPYRYEWKKKSLHISHINNFSTTLSMIMMSLPYLIFEIMTFFHVHNQRWKKSSFFHSRFELEMQCQYSFCGWGSCELNFLIFLFLTRNLLTIVCVDFQFLDCRCR